MTTETTAVTPGQRVSYFALRALLFLLGRMSVRRCARLGAFVGGCAFRVMPRRRRTVIHNLRIVYGGKRSYAECETVAREVFRRTGGNFVGGMRGGFLPVAELAESIRVKGVEHMREALSKGRGVLAVVAHMGPWEMLVHLKDPVFLGGPFGSLYRPIDNPAVDRWVRRQREKRGARLFSRRDGWTGPLDLLRKGGALAVFADQRAGGAGIPAPFFGRNVLTTRLPYIFQRKTGAALVGVSAWTREPGKWEVWIHPPIYPEREEMGTREAFTRRCNELLEETFRVSVEDGFWFHRRFRPEVKTFFPAPSPEKEGPVVRRALIVVPEDRAAASAFARGLGRFAERRPRVAFVLAGEGADRVAEEAGPVSVRPVEGGRETGVRASVRRILAVDRDGPVGIDGALILPGADVRFWGNVLTKLSLDRILGPVDGPGSGEIRRVFSEPEFPSDPAAWLALLEGVSEAT